MAGQNQKNILDYSSSLPITTSEYEKELVLNESLALEVIQCVIDDRVSLVKETQLRAKLKSIGINNRKQQNAYISFIAQWLKAENEELKHTLKDRVRFELTQLYDDAEKTKDKVMILDRMIKLDGLAEPSKHLHANINVEWGGNESES